MKYIRIIFLHFFQFFFFLIEMLWRFDEIESRPSSPWRVTKIGSNLDNALENGPWLIELRRDVRTNHSLGVTPRFIAPRRDASLRGRITCNDGAVSIARVSRLRNRFANFSFARVISSCESGSCSRHQKRNVRKRARCSRWGSRLGMAANGQNGGAVEDTWVILKCRGFREASEIIRNFQVDYSINLVPNSFVRL